MEFDFVRATVLALIQGITEFLPISSSAHLIFPSALLGWRDQGLAFDVAVHLGSLVAVIFYFRRQIAQLLRAWSSSLFGGEFTQDSKLAWMIIVATVPVVLVGFAFQDLVESRLRTVTVIAVTTVLFGLVLLVADLKSKGTVSLSAMSWRTCLVIGLSQVLALVPGTSRSGITMSAAMLCNLDRESASRFSFLLSIPVIGGASLLLGLDLLQTDNVNWLEVGYSSALTAVVAYVCIHYFLKTITAIGFLPFVIYRLLLGVVLFLFFVPL